MNGRGRIPDGIKNGILSEVKNVASQSYSQQLRDFVQYAKDEGLQVHLYVRPDTKLSAPLVDAAKRGDLKICLITNRACNK